MARNKAVSLIDSNVPVEGIIVRCETDVHWLLPVSGSVREHPVVEGIYVPFVVPHEMRLVLIGATELDEHQMRIIDRLCLQYNTPFQCNPSSGHASGDRFVQGRVIELPGIHALHQFIGWQCVLVWGG